MKISGGAGNYTVVLKNYKDSAAPLYSGTWVTLLNIYRFKGSHAVYNPAGKVLWVFIPEKLQAG